MNKTKGPYDIVKVVPSLLNEFKNLQVIIIGGGPYFDELNSIVHKEGLSEFIKILGRVSYEDLYNYYALADIFVNPTHIREAFGLVTAEAMCSGTLTIVSPLAAHKGMIKNMKTAIICDTSSSEKLKTQIQKILRNPKEFDTIRINGMNHIRNNYSIERMVNRTEEIYKKVMSIEPNQERINKKLILYLKIVPIAFFLIFYNFLWYRIKPRIAKLVKNQGRMIVG